jgi:hypothetical protein
MSSCDGVPRWTPLSLLLLLLQPAGASEQLEISASCDSDFSSLGRGVQLEGNPPFHYLRTGNPKAVTSATFGAGLAAGAIVESVSFSYQYLAGFGPGGLGSNFSLQLAGATLYSSPALDTYNYSFPANHTGYSPPQAVHVTARPLPLTVPAGGAAVSLFFRNNDRNLQLLAPLKVTVQCRSPGPCAQPGPWRPEALTVVFRGGDHGPAGTDETNTTGNCFRIPEIARAPDGELLAFAEGRYASCRPDVRPENRIVMRRSVDGGRGARWGKIQVLWGKTAAQRLKGLNYPTPIVDLHTGTVFCFFFQSGCPCPAGEPKCGCPIWRVASTDSGKSWSSPPVNMTAVGGFQGVSGGGKGIQLPSGRLVFACGGTACYSDDYGATWQKGKQATLGPGVKGFGEETIVADGRSNSSLAMFIRSGSAHSALINHAVASSRCVTATAITSAAAASAAVLSIFKWSCALPDMTIEKESR